MNSRNPQDLQPIADQPARRPGSHIDFYTQSRTVLIAADDTPVPRFGV